MFSPSEKPGTHRTDRPLHWERYVLAAKIDDFHWHDLRHTTASRLAMAGVDLYTISRILGHSDVSMTMRYAYLSPGFLQEAMSKLDRVAQVPTGTSRE
jgi:integrase